MHTFLDQFKISEYRKTFFYREVNEGKRMKKGHRAKKKEAEPTVMNEKKG